MFISEGYVVICNILSSVEQNCGKLVMFSLGVLIGLSQ